MARRSFSRAPKFLALIGAAFFVHGCSASPEISSVNLLTLAAPTTEGDMALSRGPLALSAGCIVQRVSAAENYSVVWPFGTSVETSPSGRLIVRVGGSGQEIAMGESAALVGGEMRNVDRTASRHEFSGDVSRCPAPYWLAYSVLSVNQ